MSNFMGLFCLKGVLVQAKTVQEFHVLTLKGYEKFWGKLTFGFQFSPVKIMPI